MTTPKLELIRVLTPEEAEQARAEARADFERRLPGAVRPGPTDEQMDEWWSQRQ